jgi:oligopeptide transport system substrate-binding protein
LYSGIVLLRILNTLLTFVLLGLSLATLADDSVLIIANAGEPETLDPHRYNLRLEETLLNDLFLGLTTFDAEGNIVPGVARHWQTSSDGLTWTFYLDATAKWSDGTRLVAQDFVYSLQRLQDPKTAASLAYFMGMIENATAINAGSLPITDLGVVAIDDRTLQISLEKPYPYLLERLLYPTAFPVPRHVIATVGDAWIKPEHWVSNGAYTLKSWVPQASIELEANPHFVEPAAISRVRYVPVINEQAAYNRYRSDELHVIPSFPVGNLERLKRQSSEDLRLSPLLSMFYLVFNTQSAPLDNVIVRQALSLAVDQDILVDKVLRNGARAEVSFAPSMLTGYSGPPLPHHEVAFSKRIAQAKALLKSQGYGADNPLRLELRHLNSLENKKISLAVSGMWKNIGVFTELRQGDVRSHFSDLRQGKFQVGWAGWVGENNAEHYLSLLKSDIGLVNYGRFSNSTFDALMNQAQRQATTADRNNLLLSAEQVALHFYAVVPLYSGAVRRLVHADLSGWHENPRDMHPSRYLSWKP